MIREFLDRLDVDCISKAVYIVTVLLFLAISVLSLYTLAEVHVRLTGIEADVHVNAARLDSLEVQQSVLTSQLYRIEAKLGK